MKSGLVLLTIAAALAAACAAAAPVSGDTVAAEKLLTPSCDTSQMDDYQACSSILTFNSMCTTYQLSHPGPYNCANVLLCLVGSCCPYKTMLGATNAAGIQWVNNVITMCTKPVSSLISNVVAIVDSAGEDAANEVSCLLSRDTTSVGSATDECLTMTVYEHAIKKMSIQLSYDGMAQADILRWSTEVAAAYTLETPSSPSTSRMCLKLETAWMLGEVLGSMINRKLPSQSTRNTMNKGDACANTVSLDMLDSRRNPLVAYQVDSASKAFALIARGAAYVARVTDSTCVNSSLPFSYFT